MRQFTQIVRIETRGPGLCEFTKEATAFAEGQGLSTGLLTLFCRHTSASLLIQENAARAVLEDLRAFFSSIAPEDADRYAHNDEGLDDMPAHIRAALTNVSLSVPLIAGRLVLGVWQGIFLFEHRRAPHRREIALHLFGT